MKVPMAWASQLGVLLFLIASAVAGVRLLWRGRGAGRIHERLLGVTCFFGGPLGYVPLILVVSGATPDTWTRTLRSFGHANLELSAIALYAFTCRVFRPQARAASLAAGTASLALVVTWLGLVFVDRLEHRVLSGSIWYWCDFVLRGAAYAWAAIESLRHHAAARRRLALGLVEPIVVDRFRLWGIAMTAISAMFVNAAIMATVFDGSPTPLWYLVDGACAVIAAGAIWVTFFPPRRYLARLASPER